MKHQVASSLLSLIASDEKELTPEDAAADQRYAEETLSVGEACRLLDVTPNTLRRWHKRGSIKAIRTSGGHRRFHVAEIHRVMRRRRSEQLDRPEVVGPVQPPGLPMPRLADRLADTKHRITNVGKAFYESNDVPQGYFSTADARERIDRILDSLEQDLRSGSYKQTLAEARELGVAAVEQGVRIIELYRFSELLAEAITAAVVARGSQKLRPGGDRSLQQVIRSMKHEYLDGVDSPSSLVDDSE